MPRSSGTRFTFGDFLGLGGAGPTGGGRAGFARASPAPRRPFPSSSPGDVGEALMEAIFGTLLVAAGCLALWAALAAVARSIREGLVLAVAAAAAFVAVSTEVLSLFDGLRPVPVALAWVALTLTCAEFALRRRRELGGLWHRAVAGLRRSPWSAGTSALVIAG